jgi:hypothetical protein
VCNLQWGQWLNVGPSGGVLTFQDLGSLGEFVAAIATLVTLVYLAFQIKQHTKVSRAQLTKDLFLASRSALLEIARDEDLAKIAANGGRERERLNTMENSRLTLIQLFPRCVATPNKVPQVTRYLDPTRWTAEVDLLRC